MYTTKVKNKNEIVSVKHTSRPIQVFGSGKRGPRGIQGEQGNDGPPGDPASNLVTSVNGQQGVVVLNADDISDSLTNNRFVSSAQLALIDASIQPGGNISQLTNDEGFISDLSTFSTTNLVEGSNLYYTNTRVDARIALQAGQPDGLATLGSDGKIPSSQLSAIAITDTFVVASQVAMLALTAEIGDIAVRTDLNKTFILKTAGASTLGNWQELLNPTDTVLSVNSQTGAVSLTTAHIPEASNLYYTDERVDDRVSSLLSAGVGIALSYNDAGGLLTISTQQNAIPSDLATSGPPVTLIAGQDLVFGDICYVKSDGKMGKADSDAIATATALFMALGTIANDASGSFATPGNFVRNDAWSWTVGGTIYLSGTAGAMTQTMPTATNSVVQILGVAMHADRMFFIPQLVQIENV